MIGHSRNSLSVIACGAALRDRLCHVDNFAILFEVSDSKLESYEAIIKNVLQKPCKFVIISGKYCEEFKESVLDYLVWNEELIVPFFVYDDFREAVEVFLFGDLPIEGAYDCIFISLSDCASAIESGRTIFNAASK
jgi:hypothetical protein